jgi:hypothetical protein
VTDGKKTEGVRFDWPDEAHKALQRMARAKGYESHNALARDWLLERIQQELHAAKVMLGIEDGAGISRNFPESSGKGRS